MGIIYDIEEGEGMETEDDKGLRRFIAGNKSPEERTPQEQVLLDSEDEQSAPPTRTCAYCHISYPATQSHEDAEDCREALLVRVAELEQERDEAKAVIVDALEMKDPAFEGAFTRSIEVQQLTERAEAAEAKATEYSQAYTSAAEKGNNHISEIEALTAANLALTGEVEILRTEMTKLELEKEKL